MVGPKECEGRAANTNPVDHGVGKQNEPHVPRPRLELARRFSTSHAARGILAADANANLQLLAFLLWNIGIQVLSTHEKAPRSQHIKHAHGIPMVVRARRQGRKHQQDNGG